MTVAIRFFSRRLNKINKEILINEIKKEKLPTLSSILQKKTPDSKKENLLVEKEKKSN